MASVLPPPDQYAALAPRPDGPVWRAFNDTRMLSTAGYALLLQVAHPTVGQGVHEYSSFTKDPWGRLLRTLDYVHGTIYGGPEMAGEIGRRVRAMHRGIRGTKADGSRYSAMEPDAFAWVHATLALGVVEGHRRFACEMTLADKQAFWEEWLGVGRLIGVRERDLPQDWAGFERYAARVIAEDLQWTPAIPEVVATIADNAPPGLSGPVRAGWRVAASPMALHLRVSMVGMLAPELRDRLRLPFSARDEAVLRATSALMRAADPVWRGPLRQFGPRYVRWRREALRRGDVAGGQVAVEQPVAA